MSKIITLLSVLVLFLFSASPALSKYSIDSIVMYRLKDGGMKEIRDDFTQKDKIYADFTFSPGEEEMGVEFRWINPLNKKEQSYFELVKSSQPLKKKTMICWLQMHPTLPEKIIGSRFLGRWRLEVWVNNRRVAEKAFVVGN